MTAPALPGAAPDPAPGRNDPARLPPEVEREIDAVVKEAGRAYTGHVNALPNALLDLRTAIARALGGDGEPVAYALVGKGHGRILEDPDGRLYVAATKAEADRRFGVPTDAWDTRVVPLYTRPAATGDTGEGECTTQGDFGPCGFVRVTGPANARGVTVGRTYEVSSWAGGAPRIHADGTNSYEGLVWCRTPGGEAHPNHPTWEPAVRPTPAATGGPDAR